MSDICEVRCVHPGAVDKARARVSGAPVALLAESFKVLGDPTRVGILLALSASELCVCDLAELFNVTPGAVSHQMRLLRAHRLVKARREGKLVFYSLDDDHVEGLIEKVLEHANER